MDEAVPSTEDESRRQQAKHVKEEDGSDDDDDRRPFPEVKDETGDNESVAATTDMSTRDASYDSDASTETEPDEATQTDGLDSDSNGDKPAANTSSDAPVVGGGTGEESAAGDAEPREKLPNVIHDALTVMRGLCTELPYVELHAINGNTPLSGPPSCVPETEANAAKALFRWPVRAQNLLRKRFEEEGGRIALDLETLDADEDEAVDIEDACLPALPSSLCDLVVNECRRMKMAAPANATATAVLRSKLSHLVRTAAVFTDTFLESLLTRNAVALQGNEQKYSSAAWSSIHGTPCANWRFVDETVKQQSTVGRVTLASATKKRIRARLNAIYGDAWTVALRRQDIKHNGKEEYNI
ncbi:Aste57867_18204 [Aphanomyces stellatus]|uniref:Aste57867_18204 protein n=1 Tax=Aphanomyces stellatus TaxID=120398 RepID=A0A485LAV4_9STRA|nr:hypothetical protein As57867_018142 [Aphanomyces stellatus]VFT94942.1 Aste57867_18204 [Aphanomyces stellatus]